MIHTFAVRAASTGELLPLAVAWRELEARVSVKVDSRVKNVIGDDRTSILIRDEARLIDHFATGRRSEFADGRLTFGGDWLGLGIPSRVTQLTTVGEELELIVEFGMPECAKALIHRSRVRTQLWNWLDERFGHPCPRREQKVFGIGFQRTGTTSLVTALRRLGYFALHDAPWLLPGSITGDIDWSLIDEYDVVADNPFPVLFRELDDHYPGSKFILTERDPDDWLRSVEFLVQNVSPGFEMEHYVYGIDTFDPQIYRGVYLAHNRAVRDHFADRPDSLLVLDITRDASWAPLCEFLGEPVPATPFPQSGFSRR